MRTLWKTALALSLGSAAIGGKADAQWAAGPGGAGARSERQAVPVATIARPVPLDEDASAASGAMVDPNLRPTLFRAQAADSSPRPMPAGPPSGDSRGSMFAWRPAPAAGAAPAGPPDPTAVPAGPVVIPTPDGSTSHPEWSFGGNRCGTDCAPCCTNTCDACGGNSCGADGCHFGNRFYASTEYLLWWVRGSNTPPLVTRGSVSDTTPGALGLPGTTVLFGGHGVEDNPFSGGRFMVGYWLNDGHDLGIEAGGFFLGQGSRNFAAQSFGNPVLARPILDANTGLESTELVAGPGVLAGRVTVHADTTLWGYEANLRRNWLCWCNWYVDLLIGFRGMWLDENLNVHESLAALRGTGTTFEVDDRFGTQNRFYGGQIGAIAEYRLGKWVFDVKSKLALGNTSEVVNVRGSTVISDPTFGTTTNSGGLLALSSNIGRYHRDVVTFVPEVGFNVGYQFNEHVRGFVGYSFLYWSSVARPGNQIDRVVNPNLLPPVVAGAPARPAFNFNSSDFWAQGINLGLEFRY